MFYAYDAVFFCRKISIFILLFFVLNVFIFCIFAQIFQRFPTVFSMQILVLFIFVYFCNCIASIQNFIYIFGMECYKCKFYCTGDEICIECAKQNKEIPLSRHGVSMISLDSSLIEGSRFCRTSETVNDDTWTNMIPENLAANLSTFFRCWLRLPYMEREIVAELACRELDGSSHPTLAEIGKKFGITKAGVKYKLASACSAIPSLRALFPRMSIQQK